METVTLKAYIELDYDVDYHASVRDSDGASKPAPVSLQAYVVLPNGHRVRVELSREDERELLPECQKHLDWCLKSSPPDDGDYDGRFAL